MNYPKLAGRPTEPGWYWVRTRYRTPIGRPFAMVCVALDLSGVLVDTTTDLPVDDEYGVFDNSDCWGPVQTPELLRSTDELPEA